MQSENNAKKMKDEVSVTATAAAGTQGSILPQTVQEILRNGKEKGFARDVFELSGRFVLFFLFLLKFEFFNEYLKNYLKDVEISLMR